MLKNFPHFQPLHLSDKPELDRFIRSFPPHSDYNLASLWSYDTDSSIRLCLLNGNLVVVFRDYLTNTPLLSFLGTQQADDTVSTLFSYAKDQYKKERLSLISSETISSLIRNDYAISEDRDNFDYIVSTQELIDLKGTKFIKKRNKIHAFEREYGLRIHVKHEDLSDTNVQHALVSLFQLWKTTRKKNDSETNRELLALNKLITAADQFDLHTICVFDQDCLIAFGIDEVIQQRFAVTHFEKANNSYKGIYEYLKRESAKHLKTLGCNFINLEQDLGMEGLRNAKLSYRPVQLVKKYTLHPV